MRPNKCSRLTSECFLIAAFIFSAAYYSAPIFMTQRERGVMVIVFLIRCSCSETGYESECRTCKNCSYKNSKESVKNKRKEFVVKRVEFFDLMWLFEAVFF